MFSTLDRIRNRRWFLTQNPDSTLGDRGDQMHRQRERRTHNQSEPVHRRAMIR